ncbi:MAG TPA: GNAT family N-acetyltransferase [Pyrinomonadaceae bacterium]
MSSNAKTEIELRECTTLDELAACVGLQREVFALPEIEISPVRHFVVTKNAGGFSLGAFSGGELVGFVLSVPAFLRGEKAFYSHMTAVRADFQGSGVGARLKWAQRARALELGVKFIKWTFEPVKARNAFFNLEKLGAIVTEYHENFYGTDYSTAPDAKIGLASDRLFAEWHLESEKVVKLANGVSYSETSAPAALIVVPADWSALVKSDPNAALAEQLRIREEFKTAFAAGMVGRGFARDGDRPYYVLHRE